MPKNNYTANTKVNRSPHRGFYDKHTIYEILDASFICHVAFVQGGQPVVIPMSYGRCEDQLYLHGASSARITGLLAGGSKLCITVTLVDGIVISRSMFDASINYRSVVIFGNAILINELTEKVQALKVISEQIIPGRWDEVRELHDNELKATSVLKIKIDEASAKIRQGGPDDDIRDLDNRTWAGHVPLKLKAEVPVADAALQFETDIPVSVNKLLEKYS